MAKKNIGATLSLKDGNFFSGIKSASSASDGLKSKLSGATSSLKNHGATADGVGGKLKSLAGKAVGVVAAYASFSTIKNFISDAVTLANEQAAAEQRLQTTMSNVKGTTQEQIGVIKSYASELQKVTTIGDEVSIMGASQLATFQLQANTIKTLMPAVSDLAVAQYGVSVSGEQMKSMSNLVGKVMAGNVSALSRYGVVMNDTQKNLLKTGTESQKASILVDVLKQNFGGLAEAMANTPEGRVQQLKNAWGDMKEVVGAKLYPTITKTLNWLADKIPTVQNVFTKAVNACQPIMTAFTDGVLPAIDNLFGAFKNVGTAISGAFGSENTGGISSLVTGIIPGLINVLALVANGIAGVIRNWDLLLPAILPIVTVIGLYKAAVLACNVYDTTRNNLLTISNTLHRIHNSEMLTNVRTKLLSVAASAKEIAALGASKIALVAHSAASMVAVGATKALALGQTLLNAAFIASPIGWIVLGIGAVVAVFVVLWKKCEGFRNFWKGLWNGIKNAVSVAWIFIKPIFEGIKTVVGGVKSHLSGVFGGIKQGVGIALNAAKETVQEKLSNIKTAYDEHGGGIKGAAFAAIEGVKGYYTAGFTFMDKITGGKLTAIVDKVKEKFTALKETVANIFNGIKDKIASIWDGIKGLIKTPHIVQDGTISIAGINTKIPKLGIKWYADGGIMTRPTAFGISGNTAHVGGEAGAEAILPLNLFWDNLDRALNKSSKNAGGNSVNVALNVEINADNRSADEIADDVIKVLVPKLKLCLENL